MREQIDKEEVGNSLLSDLMATNVNEELVKPITTNTEEPKIKDPTEVMKEIDKSFYTKSMDLSEQDFISDDEEEYKVSKGIVFLRILFSLLLIVAVGIGVYYIITNF